VRAALKTLPWVEQDTVKADVYNRKVTFGVTDPGEFDEKALKDALGAQNFHEVTVKSGPS
jgi:hypothetical protein